MKTEFETDLFAWVYDSRYGVGRFVRKVDNALTMLETGSDCQQVRRDFRRLWQKEKRVDMRDSIFNSIAGEYEYDPEFVSAFKMED